MAKYRFKKEHSDAQINIGILRKTITKDNLTDADVEYLKAKYPNVYDHNFEEVQTVEVEAVIEEKPIVKKPRAKKAS